MKGTLYIVSGPSGAGKGTVIKKLLADMDNVYLSISATTRKMREGEQDKINYFYVSRDEFELMIFNDELLEHTVFCGNYYGTPAKVVENKLSEGIDVILEIETDGAMQVKNKCPRAVMVFISPPSMAELEQRLRGRGSESEEAIAKRLEKAKSEIGLAKKYDYVIINREIDKAASDLGEIITAQRASKQ